MTRQGTSTTEITPVFTVEQSDLAENEETRVFNKLLLILAEIQKNNKIGFILRNSTQAFADLNKSTELTQLALLATQLFNSSEELLNACDQKVMKSAVLESSRMRILCLSISGNQLSIFMEKTVDYHRILERLTQASI